MSIFHFALSKIISVACIPVSIVFLLAAIVEQPDILLTVIFLLVAAFCFLLALWLWKREVY